MWLIATDADTSTVGPLSVALRKSANDWQGSNITRLTHKRHWQSRHPETNIPRDLAAEGRTTAAACARMRLSMVIRSRATEGRSVPEKMARSYLGFQLV